MGNLGDYQIMTTIAKRVGGPKKLALLFLGAGYIGFRPIEEVIKRFVSEKTKDSKQIEYLVEGLSVSKTATDNQGLTLREGDIVNIIVFADDGVLIEIVDNENNPYFVSKDFLAECIEEIIVVGKVS